MNHTGNLSAHKGTVLHITFYCSFTQCTSTQLFQFGLCNCTVKLFFVIFSGKRIFQYPAPDDRNGVRWSWYQYPWPSALYLYSSDGHCIFCYKKAVAHLYTCCPRMNAARPASARHGNTTGSNHRHIYQHHIPAAPAP